MTALLTCWSEYLPCVLLPTAPTTAVLCPPTQAVVNEGLSDLEYLRARMRKWDDGDDEPAAAAAQDSKQGPGASWGVPEGKEGVSDEDDSDTPMLDAAARGDQSGVGPSHTSDQAAGKGARGAKKAAGQRKGGQSPEPDGTGPAGGAGAPGSEAGGAADHGEVAAAQAGGDTAGRGAAAAGHTQHHSQDVKPDPEAAIRDTGRLFVRNLPYTATEADLTQLFGVHGDVSSVHLVLDR
jgi:multiple RNA-binding domain-containing protein 1